MNILAIDTTAARRPALRIALKGAAAYRGVSRLNLTELAEYARKVQILRADGETVAITAANVDELLAAPQPEPVAEPVAEVVAEVVAEPVKVRKISKVQVRNATQLQMLLAMGTFTQELFTAITGKTGYLPASAWTAGEHKGQPATWNPYYMACVRLGISCTHAKVDGVNQVTLAKLDDAQADAQRASLEAGRARYAAAKAARKAAKAAAAA